MAKTLGEVGDTYPRKNEGVCKIYLGFTPFVMLTRAQSAEALLSDNVNLSKPMTYRFFNKYIDGSLLISTGDFWRFQRKILTPAFHFKILDDFMGVFNKQAAKFVVYLGKLPLNEEIRVLRESSKCTINVIGETTLGHDVDAMSGENYYGRALSLLQALILVRSFRPWMWFDSIYYRFTQEGSLAKQCIKAMHGLSTRILRARLHERKEEAKERSKINGTLTPAPPEKKRLRTLIEILLDSHEQNPTLVPEKLVQSGVDLMLFAGQDTTATNLAWTVFLLGHSPDVQEKCRQELFRVLGPDPSSPVTSEHLKTLKYFDATIKESMRVYPPVPLIGRQLETDIKIKGDGRSFTIPAGVQVFVSIFHMHHDPKYFPNPEKFDPERFLDENAPHKSHPFSYVPFSGGPRNCIGQKFAMMEVKVILAHLLRNYRWTSTRARKDLKLVFEIVMRVKGDLRIRLEPLRPTERLNKENSTPDSLTA
ncbi:cytochrome P450 4V2-like [Galendromus occidentalis]|uniref:Cytochrome P450 4V2-like n=1 Tax=Galendromus occidentalis TaxID=34638 RepID=A0AAJ6QS87_9ACAR|nr:cytochrome P450 4V2-like [Galendromus occidentalis]